MTIANPWMLAAGVAIVAIGWLLRSWAARHNLVDVATDAAISAAWTTVTTRKMPGVPTEITNRIDDVRGEASHVGKASKVAGYAARHMAATVVGLIGLVCYLAGLVLAGLGLYWQ